MFGRILFVVVAVGTFVADLVTKLVLFESRDERTEAAAFIDTFRVANQGLGADIERLEAESVPIDIHFE